MIPETLVADAESSVELIPDADEDSSYFRSLESHNIYLNRNQITAIRHAEGPILTVAGAGTGKTSVLVSRTGYLMSMCGVSGRNILLVTFTRAAAQEIKQRVGLLPGLAEASKQITAGTFHSVFYRILRHASYRKELWNSSAHQMVVIKQILRQHGLSDDYEPETALAMISGYKMSMTKMDDTDVDKDIVEVWKSYENWKLEHNKCDFDDLLIDAYDFLSRSPDVLSLYQRRFRYTMVDEFQDTNRLQYVLIRMLAEPERNLFVVGDPDQTIFTWNGADADIILNFPKEYPTTRTVTLDVNYRSGAHIVGLGNHIIRNNTQRVDKMLKVATEARILPNYSDPNDGEAEAETVLNSIQSRISSEQYDLRDIAVLYRTSASAYALVDLLVKHNVPFVDYGAKSVFYDLPVIKPLVSYLRLAINPKDMDSIKNVLPSMYVSTESAMDFLRTKSTQPSLNDLLYLSGLQQFQREKLRDQIELVKLIRSMNPGVAVGRLRKYYDSYLGTRKDNKLTAHKEYQKGMVDEFEQSLKKFKTISKFLKHVHEVSQSYERMTRMLGQSDNVSEINAVKLMSIHKSKGLEFPCVFIIGMSEGILPHANAVEASAKKDLMPNQSERAKALMLMEEERRLAYVAVTRAQHELYISSPRHYRGKATSISRFLSEALSKPIDVNNKKVPKPMVKKRRTEEVQAWVCTECFGWKRASDNESLTASMKCPLCGKTMKKEMKTVEIK